MFISENIKMKIMQALMFDETDYEEDTLLSRSKRDARTLQDHVELSRDLLIAAIALGAVIGICFIVVVVVRVRKCIQNKNKVSKQPPRKQGQIRGSGRSGRAPKQSPRQGRERAPRDQRQTRSKMDPIEEYDA